MFDPRYNQEEIDFCITLGGDGTVLYMASLFEEVGRGGREGYLACGRGRWRGGMEAARERLGGGWMTARQ